MVGRRDSYHRFAVKAKLETTGSIALGIIGVLVGGSAASATPPQARDVAAGQAALAAQFGGTEGDFELSVERNLSVGGTSLWSGKYRDLRNGEIRLIYRDTSGTIGGVEILRGAIDRVEQGKSALDRKASKDLTDRALSAGPTEKLPVAVWLGVDTTDAVASVIAAHPEGLWTGERPNATDVAIQRSLRDLIDRARADAYAAAAAEVESSIASEGVLDYVSVLAPLAYFDVTPAALDMLAKHPRVRSMGLEGTHWEESLASAGPYVHANWHSGSLDQGTGVRVGIIEYHNVADVGDLNNKIVASNNIGGAITYDPAPLKHPTWVAGAVASQDATDQGIAPGAMIVSSASGANDVGQVRDRNVIRAADWAATTGDADILNVSLNMDSTAGRDEARAYFDSIAGGEAFRTVVVSSGNYNTGVDAPEWWVSSPGTSWNVLTVGGVNDGTNRLWYDGSCPCSGALYDENPNWTFNSHTDFNKPDVSAPAVGVRTADGMSSNGTSVASPIVAGIAAQLFARDPAAFTAWPELMRAVIMVGANRRVALPTGGLSTDHEGVGTVETLWSHRVFVDPTYGGWAKGTLLKGDPLSRTFTVTAGQRVRIALTWDSHTSGTMFDKTDTLTADLDLSVSYPGGTISSLTYDNSYEFVSFTATTTGTVTIRVNQPRFDRASEYWSLAWLKW